MTAQLLTHTVLHADETPVPMLKPGLGRTHRAYLWSYSTSEYDELQAVIYDFAEGRGGVHAREFWGNNHVENRIRPVALGRSNWLFAGSLRAGQRAATIMSLIQSAKLNGHDPHHYLKDVLERLPTQPAQSSRGAASAPLAAGVKYNLGLKSFASMAASLLCSFVLLSPIWPSSASAAESKRDTYLLEYQAFRPSLYFTGNEGPEIAIFTAVQSESAWRNLWAELEPRLPREMHQKAPHPFPRIDFRRQTLLVAALGATPTGGYSLSVQSVEA
jgi:hypothetical protein